MFRNNLSPTDAPIPQAVNLEKQYLQVILKKLGMAVDLHSGHITYLDNFKPFQLHCELVFIRHGETFGNCGQSSKSGQIDTKLVNNNIKTKENRIYQGNVDTVINQLTEEGKSQALAIKEQLNNEFIKKAWIPDYILVSPLTRARDTSLPFITDHGYQDKCIIYDDIKEMSFGAWENKRVCDFSTDHPCHLFYREQNALIKENNNTAQEAENFCEVILRAYRVLQDLNVKYYGKKIIMFSHSMFGAACTILLGLGQKSENGDYLAFDGKRQDGTYYTLPHAKPCILSQNNHSTGLQIS